VPGCRFVQNRVGRGAPTISRNLIKGDLMHASRLLRLLVCTACASAALAWSTGPRCSTRPSIGAAHAPRPALPTTAASAAAAATAALLHADAAFAETSANNYASSAPDYDIFVVGAALLLVVLTGLLQLSLGDIQAEEANLPSSVALINKNRQKTNSFIKSKK
jgi:hypothetical protein